MKLKDMVETLRMAQRMELRDAEGFQICICNTDSILLQHYLECEVTEWFAGSAPFTQCDFTVYIKVGEE